MNQENQPLKGRDIVKALREIASRLEQSADVLDVDAVKIETDLLSRPEGQRLRLWGAFGPGIDWVMDAGREIAVAETTQD